MPIEKLVSEPTVESVLRETRELYKRLADQDEKIRAILNHLNVYLDREIIQTKYTTKSFDVANNAGCCVQSPRPL